MNAVQGFKRYISQTGFVQRGTTPLNMWYTGVQNQAGLSNTVCTINFLFGSIFVLSRPAVLSKLSFEVVAGAVNSVGRCGIYAATSPTNLYPSKLIVDGGEKDCSSNGVKTTSGLSVVMPAGVYWTVVSSGVLQPTLRFHVIGGTPSSLGVVNTLTSGQCRLQLANAYGALPATFPAGGSLVGGGPAFVVGLEFA